MKTACAILWTVMVAGNLVAADAGSWQNLASLKPAQKVEIATKGDTAKGEFVRIGAAAGGGGGAAAGAALGSRLANESGGDFNNLKPAIAAACAGSGALIGALIGTAARRHASSTSRSGSSSESASPTTA